MALRGKRNLKHKDKTFKIKVGDVVIIKGEKKNRGHWKLGIVNHLHIGKGNIIRVAQLRIGNYRFNYFIHWNCTVKALQQQTRMRRKMK